MSCRVSRAETIERLGLVVLLVLAGILHMQLLDVRSPWFDEGYSLFVAGLGPGRIWNSCGTTRASPCLLPFAFLADAHL